MPTPGESNQLAEASALIQWLEAEVKARLLLIDEKLDQALELGLSTRVTAHSKMPGECKRMMEALAHTTHGAEYVKPARPDIASNLGSSSSSSTLRSQASCISNQQKANGEGGDSIEQGSDFERRNNSSFSTKMTQWLELRKRGARSTFLFNVLEDSESGKAAYLYEKLMPVVIILAVFTTLVQSMDEPPITGFPAAVLETSIDVLFTLEIIMRFMVCPSRWAFFRNVYNAIDILAAAPLALRVAVGFVLVRPDSDPGEIRHSLPLAFLLGVVPVLRLLKVLRRFQQFHLLLRAFRIAFEALPVMLFIYMVLMLCLTALIYIFEEGTNIPTLPKAMWLAFVSITTVGYGDFAPQSTAGRMLVAFFVFLSMLYMSIPLGIIGNAFSEVWRDRDRILLMQKTRHRLVQWGYHAEDIPRLFKYFDIDKDDELSLDEFSNMVSEMKLGLHEARVFELFNIFDNDQSGGITDMEFVRGLFPENYHRIYGSAKYSVLAFPGNMSGSG